MGDDGNLLVEGLLGLTKGWPRGVTDDFLALLGLAFELGPEDLGPRGRAMLRGFHERAGSVEAYLASHPLPPEVGRDIRALIARVVGAGAERQAPKVHRLLATAEAKRPLTGHASDAGSLFQLRLAR